MLKFGVIFQAAFIQNQEIILELFILVRYLLAVLNYKFCGLCIRGHSKISRMQNFSKA